MNYEDLTWDELLNLPPEEQAKVPREVYTEAYMKAHPILRFTAVRVE